MLACMQKLLVKICRQEYKLIQELKVKFTFILDLNLSKCTIGGGWRTEKLCPKKLGHKGSQLDPGNMT